MEKFSSQITFLSFRDYPAGKEFMEKLLELEPVYDIGWACVYRVAQGAFLGAVDHSRSAPLPAENKGTLVSLTTRSIERLHERVSAVPESAAAPIAEVPGAGLKSFFFTGPEGYAFEIQQFTLPEAEKLFG